MTIPAKGSVTDPELKSAIDALRAGIAAAAPVSKLTALQAQVDAIDIKLANKSFGDSSFDSGASSLLKNLQENESVSRILRDKRGSAVLHLKGAEYAELMDRKSIITATTSGTVGGDPLAPVGVQTTGVLTLDRIPGVTPEARQVLKVRNVLSARPTTMTAVDFVKVNQPMSIASPVPEASTKPENNMTFTAISERVKLLATFILASRQVLDDFTELMGFLSSTLKFYVDLEEELQILSGDNTGENLHGIIPQAASFNSALLPPALQGWQRIDVVGAAISQINTAKEIDPTFIIMHPSDWWKIALTKDGFGRYILAEPGSLLSPRIFGLDVVTTTSIALGTFLVGSGSPVAAEIRDRMDTVVEISTEDSTNFRQNLITVRCERRSAMVVKRPNSFLTGTWTTSP